MAVWDTLWEPIHPDLWETSYYGIYPHGRSAGARFAMEEDLANLGIGGSRAIRSATTTGPAIQIDASTGSVPGGYATKASGVWTFKPNLVAYGAVDLAPDVKCRWRNLTIANKWYDISRTNPVTGNTQNDGRTLLSPMPFQEAWGKDSVILSTSSGGAHLDTEETLMLGMGLGSVNNWGKAYRLRVVGVPPADAKIKLRVRLHLKASGSATGAAGAGEGSPNHDADRGAVDTVDTALVALTGRAIFGALAAISDTTTGVLKTKKNLWWQGGSSANNAAVTCYYNTPHDTVLTNGNDVVVDNNDKITLADADGTGGIVVQQITGLGAGTSWSVSVTQVDSNHGNEKAVQSKFVRSLARLATWPTIGGVTYLDPRQSTGYPSGMHRWECKNRLSDFIGWGNNVAPMYFWHYTDWGVHWQRIVALGGGHLDTHQVGRADGFDLSGQLPLHAYFIWMIANAGLFMQSPTALQKGLVCWCGLIQFRGQGSKPYHLTGNNVVGCGFARVFIDEFARDPATGLWLEPRERANSGDYYEAGVTNPGTIIHDRVKRWSSTTGAGAYIDVPNPARQVSLATALPGKEAAIPAMPPGGVSGTPTITSFTPTSGDEGVTVTITGTNYFAPEAIEFSDGAGGWIAAAVFSRVDDAHVTAVVPVNAKTGHIRVRAPGGTVESATNFTVTVPAPTLISQSVESGFPGTVVVLTGTNFRTVTAVKLNGVALTVGTYSVDSLTQITATVDAAATDGVWRVEAAGGNINSAFSFDVIPLPPVIDSFAPTSGRVGDVIRVTGQRLQATITGITVGGVAVVTFAYVDDNNVDVTIPALTVDGPIVITKASGVATSSGPFDVIAASAGIATFKEIRDEG